MTPRWVYVAYRDAHTLGAFPNMRQARAACEAAHGGPFTDPWWRGGKSLHNGGSGHTYWIDRAKWKG